jgi:hypothetical protein
MPERISNVLFAIMGTTLAFIPQEISRRNQNKQNLKRMLLEHDLRRLEEVEKYILKQIMTMPPF